MLFNLGCVCVHSSSMRQSPSYVISVSKKDRREYGRATNILVVLRSIVHHQVLLVTVNVT